MQQTAGRIKGEIDKDKITVKYFNNILSVNDRLRRNILCEALEIINNTNRKIVYINIENYIHENSMHAFQGHIDYSPRQIIWWWNNSFYEF